MLPLSKIFGLAGKEDIALVQDGTIYYMVLNTKYNLITYDAIKKIEKILDTVEKTKGKGVFVTVSSSPKVFCAGFNIKPWA